MKTFFFFFFWRALALCVLGPWPWPRAFLSLASRVSVLGKAVLGLGLGLGFFLCPWPWPWPRALCPRLHLWFLLLSIQNKLTFLNTKQVGLSTVSNVYIIQKIFFPKSVPKHKSVSFFQYLVQSWQHCSWCFVNVI